MNNDTIIIYQGGDGKIANQKYMVATVYGWETKFKSSGNPTKVISKYVVRASDLTIDEALDLVESNNFTDTIEVGKKN